MKTVATTIKADVVIYQDGTVEVVPELPNVLPAQVTLMDIDAFLLRCALSPVALAEYGMRLYYLDASASAMVDVGERIGFDWVMSELARGRQDRVADLNFDLKAKRQQAQWCINSEEEPDSPLSEQDRTRLKDGWATGCHYAVCVALRTSETFRQAYALAKRLSEEHTDPAPTY